MQAKLNEDYIEEIIKNIDERLIEGYVQTLQDFGPKGTQTEVIDKVNVRN